MDMSLTPALAPEAQAIWPPPKPERTLAGPSVPLEIVSEYTPAGDQPQAIKELVSGVREGENDQVLLGVTGSGKTFTMAKIIEETQRPAIVLAVSARLRLTRR